LDHKVAKCTGGPTGWPGYAVAYPKPALLSNNFFNSDLIKFKLQLDNYIDDIKHEDSFKGLTNLVVLSVKLVQTGRHKVYDMVYDLLKLVLLLLVVTISVERVDFCQN